MAKTLLPTPPSDQEESAAERTARHKRVLREMADLALYVARIVAQKIPPGPEHQEDQEPPADPCPGVPEPAAPARTTPTICALNSGRTQSYACIFARLCSEVRQIVALEASIAAGPPSAGSGPKIPRIPADPRHTRLREALDFVTKKHPDRTALRREAETRIEAALSADPDEAILLFPDHLMAVCDDLGIEIDWSKVPDEYLGTYDENKVEPDPDPATPVPEPPNLAPTEPLHPPWSQISKASPPNPIQPRAGPNPQPASSPRA